MDLWNNRDWTPMLLGEVFEPFNSNDYIFEVKFDGARSIIFASPNSVTIISRNKTDVTKLYPELQCIKKLVKKKTIFDGEIIALDGRYPSFSKLQERMHLKSESMINKQEEENPVTFVCFDILYEDKNLIQLSLMERKKKLKKYKENNCFFVSKYIDEDGINMFNNIKKLDLEGIIAKLKNSPYEISTRSNSWLKIKNYKEENFLIGGYLKTKSDYAVTLILGEYRNNEFYYVGKVTLGMKNNLYKKVLKEKIINKSPFQDFYENAVYLNPCLKCSVKYMERTNNNHLRQPFIDFNN